MCLSATICIFTTFVSYFVVLAFGLIVRKHRVGMSVSITIMPHWNQINDANSEEWKLNIIAAMSCESEGRLYFNSSDIFVKDDYEKRELFCIVRLIYDSVSCLIKSSGSTPWLAFVGNCTRRKELEIRWLRAQESRAPVYQRQCWTETGERKCLPVKYKQEFVFFNQASKIIHVGALSSVFLGSFELSLFLPAILAPEGCIYHTQLWLFKRFSAA